MFARIGGHNSIKIQAVTISAAQKNITKRLKAQKQRPLKDKKKELIMMLRITNDKDNENYTKHFKNY